MLVSLLEAGKRDRVSRVSINWGIATVLIVLTEAACITAVAAISGIIWQALADGHAAKGETLIDVGLLTAILYIVPFLPSGQYRVDQFLADRRTLPRIINVWAIACAALAVLTLSTGLTHMPIAGLVVFALLGGATVVVTDAAISRILRSLVAAGVIARRRLLVVGPRSSVDRFLKQHSVRKSGIEVSAAVMLTLTEGAVDGEPAAQSALIDRAIDEARALGVADVLILSEIDGHADRMTAIADRFIDLPVTIHLGETSLATRYPQLCAAQIGNARTLELRPAPLSPFQQTLKRSFDVLGASALLIALSPLLAVVAVLIKLDSPGPIMFRQRRRGFNQREFHILKFRTMTTLDDGAVIKQATANDPRVTRIGRILRRLNIDELPQLINVVTGDMSLVGPRPHALAHDKHYERVIRRYVRRSNVKPGITGWAQVNGFRGPTVTEDAMRSRVAQDLFYIENWSIAFDLYILALTVLSRRAFHNAL